MALHTESIKPIIHPGILIKDKLRAANIKAKFLAQKIGVANSQFVDILNGKRRLTPRIALALEQELGVRAVDLVRQQAEYELALERMLVTHEQSVVLASPAPSLNGGLIQPSHYRGK